MLQDSSLKPKILNVIQAHTGIELAIVFGSLASGAADCESDLDLAVMAREPLSVDQKVELISELAQQIGRPVDLIDLRKVGEPLLGQILQHGVRIFGSDTDYANLIRRHLFDREDFLPYRNRILAERRQSWIGK